MACSLHDNDTGLDKMCTQNAKAEAEAKKENYFISSFHRYSSFSQIEIQL